MFDIGFSELMIIGVVALIVLGPERLPRVARTAGQWVARAQRYVNDVKADIAREGELAELKALRDQVETAGREVENTIRKEAEQFSETVNTAKQDLTAQVEAIKANESSPDAAHDHSALADQSLPHTAGDPAHHPVSAAQTELFTPAEALPHHHDPAHDPAVQRMEAELLSDEIYKLEERLARLRRDADVLRNMAPSA
jgi:sec-independent protein translocase protein TatB